MKNLPDKRESNRTNRVVLRTMRLRKLNSKKVCRLKEAINKKTRTCNLSLKWNRNNLNNEEESNRNNTILLMAEKI